MHQRTHRCFFIDPEYLEDINNDKRATDEFSNDYEEGSDDYDDNEDELPIAVTGKHRVTSNRMFSSPDDVSDYESIYLSLNEVFLLTS
jgi:hypothetical protein